MADPIIELSSGFVRGLVEKHEEGFDYYAFKGIPYAEPPIGELRFKDPTPIKPWAGVLDCKKFGPPCLQFDFILDTVNHEEDCLNLNLYTRSIDNWADRPVMFIVHGGSFIMGSNSDTFFGPEYLIRKDIVLVIPNYRLGVLGFLNLEDEIAPGNQGLKDQLLALRWVRDNVRQFGGNPDNVTLVGLSAGSTAAHYLALSPLSKGLVHKVIFQGTFVYNAWMIVKNPKSNAVKLCSILGRKITDSEEILKFLRTIDAKRLCQAQRTLISSMDFTKESIAWGPSIDDKSSNPVMPIDPTTAASAGVHLPCLVGYNSHEAIVVLRGIKIRDARHTYIPPLTSDEITFACGMSRSDFFRHCNIDFNRAFIYHSLDVVERHNLSPSKIRHLYFGDEDLTERNLDKFVRFIMDLNYVEATHRFARTQAERGSAATYLFIFSFVTTSMSLGRAIVREPPEGCSHLDDLSFLFKMRIFETLGLPYFEKGTRDYRMMERLTEMWTNFAEFGKPTIDTSDLIPVHWTPVTDGTVLRYLNIDDNMMMKSTINFDRKMLMAKNT